MSGETEQRRVTKAGLAAVLDVSVQAIDGWLARGCPYLEKPGRGRRSYSFDVAEVVSWRLAHQREQMEKAATIACDVDEARRRKAAAEAQMAEMDLEERRGELVRIEDVQAWIVADYTHVRTRLLAMPSKMAARITGLRDANDVHAALKDEIYRALDELSRAPETYGAEVPNG